MDNRDDSDLVARCLGGDSAAFGPLVERYQRVLFNVARRMVRNREDAEDLAQAAFLKAYARLESYDGEHKFFSWIYRILVNESINFLNRRRPDDELPSALPSAENPESTVYSTELKRHVQVALSQLSQEYREVVILRHFAELSYGEMGEALAIPEKTVKSRLHTARQRLAELLKAPLEAR